MMMEIGMFMLVFPFSLSLILLPCFQYLSDKRGLSYLDFSAPSKIFFLGFLDGVCCSD